MKIRNDYAVWKAWLSDFADDSASSVDGLPPMDVASLGVDVLDRLTMEASRAVNTRLAAWQQRLGEDLKVLRGPDDLRSVIISARKRFIPIWSFACCPLLIPALRAALQEGLRDALISQQMALEASIARSTFPSRESLLLAARDTTLLPALSGGPTEGRDSIAGVMGRSALCSTEPLGGTDA